MPAGPEIGCVTVFGGSGFLGARIVERLAAQGISVRVAVRHPDHGGKSETPEQSGKILTVYADVRDETAVDLAMEGSDAVVNAVGLYVERGAETFEAVHELGAVNVAHQCTVQGISRLIHISGIGAELHSPSRYVRARAKGELLVKDIFSPVTILRPSVLFGPDDRFLNTLARIIRRAPVLPLFGDGGTRLQAVYVGDVADAVLAALRDPGSRGKTYELGGPQAYSYRSLIETLLERTGKRRLLLPVPFLLWDFVAAIVSVLPAPPLTRDQITLMKRDNVVAANTLSLEDLGVSATALEDILADYAF